MDSSILSIENTGRLKKECIKEKKMQKSGKDLYKYEFLLYTVFIPIKEKRNKKGIF